MPKHHDIALLKAQWTLLTDGADGAIGAVRIQNIGPDIVLVQATPDTTTPAGEGAAKGALRLHPGEILSASDNLATLFPGVAGARHLFGWTERAGNVSVSHPSSAVPLNGMQVSGAQATDARGMLALAVRLDADAAIVADSQYTFLSVDDAGRLKVAAQPASYPLVSGPIAAAGVQLACPVSRTSNVMVSMVAAALAGHNASFEGSLDSTNGVDGNWFPVQAVRSNGNTIETATGVLAATPAYAWELSVNGLNWFRVRATAHGAGTATYSIQRATYATEPIPAAQASATQPVSLAALPAIVGQGAESAAAAGNAVRGGSRVRTAHDTTLIASDAVDHTATTAGQLLVKPGGLTESAWNASLALTTTVAAALAAAGGVGLKRHMTGLQAINTGAAIVDLIILDGATERWRLPLPINVPVDINFGETHLIATANAALNANLSAAGTVRVNAQGYTAP